MAWLLPIAVFANLLYLVMITKYWKSWRKKRKIGIIIILISLSLLNIALFPSIKPKTVLLFVAMYVLLVGVVISYFFGRTNEVG